nr:MAG TPA: hypothetical protein [Caudoviricetes sp.]
MITLIFVKYNLIRLYLLHNTCTLSFYLAIFASQKRKRKRNYGKS